MAFQTIIDIQRSDALDAGSIGLPVIMIIFKKVSMLKKLEIFNQIRDIIWIEKVLKQAGVVCDINSQNCVCIVQGE